MDERVAQLIRQGQGAAQRGNNDLAREYLQAAVDLDANNPTAWLWLAGVLTQPADVKYALEQVLRTDPGNIRAVQGLEQINAVLAAQPQAPAGPPPRDSLAFTESAQTPMPRGGTSSLGGGGAPTGTLSIEEELRAALRAEPAMQGDPYGAGGGDMGRSRPAIIVFFQGDDMIYRVGVAFLTFTLVIGIVFFIVSLLGIISA